MNYKDAINVSQIWAARGYTNLGECVVSVSFYDNQLMWRTGWGGDWAMTWKPVPEDELFKLDELTFRPTGQKPKDQLSEEILANFDDANDATLTAEMQAAMEEIAGEYELETELRDNYFEAYD